MIQESTKMRTPTLMITICVIILVGCMMPASAQNSYVYVEGEVDGGSFNFTGSGAYWDWNIYLKGWDIANVDLTNQWDQASSTVKYEDIGDGEIKVKVTEYTSGDEMYYFRWEQMLIDGDGTYSPGGGRNVELVNSPNVTGYIEYRERDRKAVFLFDTRHTSADLKVVVHNGELLENASVSLINGNQKVKWTDENGVAEFSPSTGTYHMIVEHENFSAMLVDDLRIEASKSYLIQVNMSDCLTSSGVAVCSNDADDLIVYYKDKEPAMGTISPQGYVDYFADQMRTCKSGENNCADGTLERMATKWGIYPTDLNVLLYSCNITNLGCIDGMTEVEINFVVKNYQQYECEYVVCLVYGNKTIELQHDILPKTWSEHAKCEYTALVAIENCDPVSTVYLTVESERAD